MEASQTTEAAPTVHPETDGKLETQWWSDSVWFLQSRDLTPRIPGTAPLKTLDSCFALNVCGSGSDSELTQLGLLFIVWHMFWLQTQDILPRYLIPWLCTLLPHPSTCLLWRYIYLCLSSGQSCLIPWPSIPRPHTHTLRARCHWEHRHVKPEDAILKIGWSGDRPVFPMKTVRALVATMSPGE